MIPAQLRRTTDDPTVGTVRLMVALVFLMAGPMKLFVPRLADAWVGQLAEAGIPLQTLSRWSVPFVELALGIVLAIGYLVRLAAVVVIVVMVVATYVHVVVDDPTLFPLQPNEPIIPSLIIAMSLWLLWRGAGAWSSDLRATREAAWLSGG